MKRSFAIVMHHLLPLSMAVCLTAVTGCSGNGNVVESSPDEEAVSVYITDAVSEESSNTEGTVSPAGGAEAAAAQQAVDGSTASGAQFAAESAGTGNTAGSAVAAAEASEESRTGGSAQYAAENAAGGRTQGNAQFPAENAGENRTEAADPFAISGQGTTAETTRDSAFALGGEDGVDTDVAPEEEPPVRTTPDTALKESVLYEALASCTGWGESAGSSLRAASAATRLLLWSNLAGTGAADPTLLQTAVTAEIQRLTPEERQSLQDNWSSVSYDVSMILDEYDSISYILEDAGCAETAKEAASDQDVLSNWRASEKVLSSILEAGTVPEEAASGEAASGEAASGEGMTSAAAASDENEPGLPAVIDEEDDAEEDSGETGGSDSQNTNQEPSSAQPVPSSQGTPAAQPVPSSQGTPAAQPVPSSQGTPAAQPVPVSN